MSQSNTPSPGGQRSLRVPLNLAERRMKQGLSLEQIAEATKISMRFLRAIEAENFEEVPGGIYLRSYLRQYAVAVGCNPGELLEAAGCEVTDEVRGGRKSEKWPEGSRVPLGKLGNTP